MGGIGERRGGEEDVKKAAICTRKRVRYGAEYGDKERISHTLHRIRTHAAVNEALQPTSATQPNQTWAGRCTGKMGLGWVDNEGWRMAFRDSWAIEKGKKKNDRKIR